MGAILADDMGLGKTLQALCVVETNAIVVCPRSVWKAGGTRRSVFDLPFAFRFTTGRSGNWRRTDLVITTYAIFRQDEKLLLKNEWDMVILDEAGHQESGKQNRKAAHSARASSESQ